MRGAPPSWALWGPKGPMRGGGAPHGPYGAPRAPEGGYWEASPGGESPRAESGPAAPPSLGRIFASAPKSESDPGFLVDKKVEIWPIWTHHEHRKACLVIFVKRRGVKNSTHLTSYGRLKLARKENVPKRPRLPMST